MTVSTEKISEFCTYLKERECSPNTISKYGHDVKVFADFIENREITKTETLEYKEMLVKKYAVASVNSMLAALNCFLGFIGLESCRIKALKVQRNTFLSEEKELTKDEYRKLLREARSNSNRRLELTIKTICSTGIRVSELQYITVKAVKTGKVVINCKGKTRVIFIPEELRRELKEYLKKQKNTDDPVFVTRSGKPYDRSNIWTDMKKLAKKAGVNPDKLFPQRFLLEPTQRQTVHQ